MKPSAVNAIIQQMTSQGVQFIDVTEAGEKLPVEVLSWAVSYALQNRLNLRYRINGGHFYIGSAEFVNTMQSSQTSG